MMRSYKQAICDYCHAGIDLYPNPISTKIFNEILTEKGSVVEGRKHFCGKMCHSLFLKKVSHE